MSDHTHRGKYLPSRWTRCLTPLAFVILHVQVFAGGWHDKTSQYPGYHINDIVCRDINGRQLVAACDFGHVAMSNDGGMSWKFIPTGTGAHLQAIETAVIGPDTVIIAVGDAGAIVRSLNFGPWEITNSGVEDLSAVIYDGAHIWIGGSNNLLRYSADKGVGWTDAVISAGTVSITDMILSRYGEIIIGLEGSSSVLLRDIDGDKTFEVEETFPDLFLYTIYEHFSGLYLGGEDLISTNGVIVRKNDSGIDWDPAVINIKPELTMPVIAVTGIETAGPHIWMATSDGILFESDEFVTSVAPVFQDPKGRQIRSLSSAPPGAAVPRGWAGGSEGLMLRHDFSAVYLEPRPNGYSRPAENIIRVGFSDIPELNSVLKGLHVYSTIQGYRSLIGVDYVPFDSTMVDVFLDRGAVPGEKLNIIMSDWITEQKTGQILSPSACDIDAISSGSPGLQFETPGYSFWLGDQTTNYVTGFFNEDDSFDLITFARDTLFCFAGDGTGQFGGVQKVPVDLGIATNPVIRTQLKVSDINRDGRPDLILFDDLTVQQLINSSTVDFSFYPANSFSSANIYDIETVSVDHDSTMDIVIINDDTLQSRVQVDEFFEGVQSSSESQPDLRRIITRDIDMDGIPDFAALNASNDIVILRNHADGHTESMAVLTGNFVEFDLRDQNQDGLMDVYGIENDRLRIFKHEPEWDFSQVNTIFQISPDEIISASCFDFNGDELVDIIVGTQSNHLKFFQNIDGFNFSEIEPEQQFIDINPEGLLNGDFNQDARLDLGVYSYTTGDYQLVLQHMDNDPFNNFDSVSVENGRVYLRWTPYEPALELNFYNIYRDTQPSVTSFLTSVTTNEFIDSTVVTGQRYYYRIEAIDLNSNVFPITDGVRVDVSPELSGSVAGVLADTLVPYRVTAPIEVRQDSTLDIRPNVKLIFEENTGLTVFGNLIVQGLPEEFVSFRSKDGLTVWNGIDFQLANTDTIRMQWFDVENALVGLDIINRQAKLQYAGISRCQTGIRVRFNQGYLDARNLLIRDNDTGISTFNSSRSLLKNVTIAGNLNEGIISQENSSLSLKNGIVWYNNSSIDGTVKFGPDIVNLSSLPVDIKYSTVDSIQGSGNLMARSRIEPLFQNTGTDSMEYLPAFMSATIDFGDPADDYSQEPDFNGGRINQGVYGGTPFAVPTIQPNINPTPSDTVRLAAFPGESASTDVTLENNGNVALDINSIRNTTPEFLIDAPNTFSLPPGETAVITVNFTAPERKEYFDELLIETNDPHHPPPGYRIILKGEGLNRRPVFVNSTLNPAFQDSVYRDTLTATDPEGDVIRFSALNVPSWLTVSPEGYLSGIPSNADVGNNPVEFLAIDEFGDADTLISSIRVFNVNDPPRFTTVSLAPAIEDSVYLDSLIAVDIDPGDTLRFSALNVPAWLKVEPSGLLTGLPTNDDVTPGIPVSIRVTDGNFGFDTLNTSIRVINTNDPPEFTGIPDTTIYTYVPFSMPVGVIDIDGDTLTFSDNTELFDIDPDSAIIRFTPVITDTGRYEIIMTASDADVTVSDTLVLTIELTPVAVAQNVEITPEDQAISLKWLNLDDPFYSGTVIAWSTAAQVTDPDAAANRIDTVFTPGATVSYRIPHLGIAENYFISIFNYFEPDIRIYSDPVEVSAATLSPQLTFDFSKRDIYVPPERTLDDSLWIRNTGGGTMIMRVSYEPNVLLDRWFRMDTTVHFIPPFDSTALRFRMQPTSDMLDIPHRVPLTMQTNEVDELPRDFELVLKILFDKYKPQIMMTVQPDSLHPFAAARFAFLANDTINIEGWDIGSPTDSLLMRYDFSRVTVNGPEPIRSETDIPLSSVDFYPLEDGLYRFNLWVFDREGNGRNDADHTFRQNFVVSATRNTIGPKRWFLASFPREQDRPLSGVFADSTARVFRWSNQDNKYISYLDSTLKAGHGIWILSFKRRDLDISSIPLETGADSVTVRIEAGWNQIGLPSAYPVRISDLKFHADSDNMVYSLSEAVQKQLISPAVYWYRSSFDIEGYEWGEIDSTVAYPWRGYWILTKSSGTLIYPRQPYFPEKRNAPPSDTAPVALGKQDAQSWQISLSLENDRFRDRNNIFGTGSVDETLPVYEPPHLSDYCSAYFVSDQGNLSRELREPLREIDQVHRWTLIASSHSTGGEHTLRWNPDDIGPGLYVYLINHHTEEIVDLSQQASYQFTPGQESNRFTIYATLDPDFEPKIIPLNYKLMQNYPNPFNPVTTIKFGIPASADMQPVSLKIYNILGQEIASLVDGPLTSGYHEIRWNGLNTAGRKVASGVYFYRLTGQDFQDIRKMVLIK